MSRSTPPPAAAPPPPRKPLSMLWVLAAVGCFVVIHTVINLAYRKPGPAHEPAAEARARQRGFVRTERHGWTHYAPQLAPADAATITTAEITRSPAPGNIFEAVSFELAGRPDREPKLHSGPAVLEAPATAPSDEMLRLRLHFPAPAASRGFGRPLAYSKENHLHIFLQNDERPAPGEDPVPVAPAIDLTFAPGALTAGEWRGTLYTRDTIFAWSFVVPAAPVH